MSSSAPKIQGPNLVGVAGRFARQIFPLPATGAAIGRESDNDVVLTGASISRRHALIESDKGGYALVGLSPNGTWLNFRRVDGRQPLKHGDRLRIDRDEFLFVDADKNKFDTRGYKLAERETVAVGKLVFDAGAGEQEMLLEEPTITIGRDATNDIVVDLPGVSGSHCKIRTIDGTYLLVDLKSTNGTYLEDGDKRIESVALQPGMAFRVGSCKIRFGLEEVTRTRVPEAPAPPVFTQPSLVETLLPVAAAFCLVLTFVFLFLIMISPKPPAPGPGPAPGEVR